MRCTNCIGSLAAFDAEDLVPILCDDNPVGYFCSTNCEAQFKREFPEKYAELTDGDKPSL